MSIAPISARLSGMAAESVFNPCYVVSLSYWRWEASQRQILYDYVDSLLCCCVHVQIGVDYREVGATQVRLQRSVHYITVLRREGIILEAVGADASTARKLLGGGGGGVYRASTVQLLSQQTAKSMKQFHNINGLSGRAGVYEGKANSKRCVCRCFLKVAAETAERTDSGRLF